MAGVGGQLIQYDWYPYEKRLEHRHARTEKTMWRQGEDGDLQIKEKGLWMKSTLL